MRDAGLPVELRVEGTWRPLPPGLDISAYRILQEGLTMCSEHAHATRARILIRFAPASWSSRSRTMEPALGTATAVPGHGLLGMRERVALYGGVLEARNGNDGGFVLRARLPYAQRRREHPGARRG